MSNHKKAQAAATLSIPAAEAGTSKNVIPKHMTITGTH